MKILVIGASGMIGSTVLRVLCENSSWKVWGTVRNGDVRRYFPATTAGSLIDSVDVENWDCMTRVFEETRPDVVINCAGLTKHKARSDDPLQALPINALMPHRMANLCRLMGARFVHVSTDCVFSGTKGVYRETDFADARDVYGKSKVLGEVVDGGAVTLRTSTIGHELQTKYGLLEWFLSQGARCKGYTKAIFSGLPSVLFAQVIRDVVIPNQNLTGLYHVAAQPIDKFTLLQLIAKAYDKTIEIEPDGGLVIDRSLESERFREETGYVAPSWTEMIKLMRAYG